MLHVTLNSGLSCNVRTNTCVTAPSVPVECPSQEVVQVRGLWVVFQGNLKQGHHL